MHTYQIDPKHSAHRVQVNIARLLVLGLTVPEFLTSLIEGDSLTFILGVVLIAGIAMTIVPWMWGRRGQGSIDVDEAGIQLRMRGVNAFDTRARMRV